jgi:GT2 family glycosyltransferase
VREKVRAVARHPALLCYAVGNEIQASLVRWIGRRRVERYIERLYRAIKAEDPDGLVTYVNYPTTEYLQLTFLDLLAFNVYLERQDRLAAYLARLQNVSDERPLIMSELGLDSLREGEKAQAESLDWQIRTAFAAGCAGAFVFAWTDEWHRAEADVEDWAFGLTTRDRRPKQALSAVSRAFDEVPFPRNIDWPRISVVVCSFNGAATIRDTLEGLQGLEYPNFEVIVVNDGSTDEVPDIATEYPVRLISTENRGLSNARNTGWEAATGEIVAYIDDDAYPDPHWLTYLGAAFMRPERVGIGGPNLAPPGDGLIAEAVANSPGGPVHVLLSDDEAEHIPGCNMAFRKEALVAVGGFDPRYRTAGDDVDLCWRLQEKGWTLGFSAAAMVWHHRRNSVHAYWRQQFGYGRAEALLEEKWPEKYNALGHTTWGGRLYGAGLTLQLRLRQRVYQGVMGSAPFQSIYQPAPGTLFSLPLMPEWYLLVVVLGILAMVGVVWTPMLFALPLFVIAIALPIGQAALSAGKATIMRTQAKRTRRRLKLRLLTAFLHLLQPLARLRGRLRHGLTLWRQRGAGRLRLPIRRSFAIWTERWAPPETRPQFIEDTLRANGLRVVHGGPYDQWDLSVPGGLLGSARMLMAIEDHGAGTQYIRLRVWPKFGWGGTVFVVLFSGLGVLATLDGAWAAAVVLAGIGLIGALRGAQESAFATGALHGAIAQLEHELKDT